MWCRKVQSQLSAYADGELTPVMTQQVRDHLAGCERCAREHSGLRSLATLTSAIPFEEVSGALHQRILGSLHQATFAPEPMRAPSPRRTSPPRTWAWAAFATGVIAIACGALQHRPQGGLTASNLATTRILPSAPAEVTVSKTHAAEATAPDADARPENPMPPASVPEVRAALATEPAETADDKQPTQGTVPPDTAPRSKPAAERLASVISPMNSERPQPAPVNPSGKLATEPRVSEPSVPAAAPVAMRENLMTVPGDPVVNNTGPLGPPEPVVSMEKEAANRMVGMAMETESPGEEDEGLRSFRMFLQENGRTVPQPPATMPGRERRMRKSL